MTRTLLLLLAAIAAFAAEDPWAKVQDLNTGAEIRVYQRGSSQPVSARFAELADASLVILLKNRQTAIPKEQIDRVDYRPDSRDRVKKRVTMKREPTDPNSPVPDLRKPSDTYSSSVVIGSKPDFQTVYRRPAPAPKEKPEEKKAVK